MTWFKVDDGLPFHRKVLSIPRRDRPAAMGLWVLAGAWSAHHLTDGAIPIFLVKELGCPPAAAKSLVRSGLWRESEHGFVFHDWESQQPSRTEVQVTRAKRAEAGRRGGQASAQARAAASATPNGQANGKQTVKQNSTDWQPRPVPSRPLVVEVEGHPQVADAQGAVTMIQQRMNTTETVAASVARTVQERFQPRDLEKYLTRIPDEELRKLMPTAGNQPPKPDEMCDHGRHRDFCPFCKAGEK